MRRRIIATVLVASVASVMWAAPTPASAQAPTARYIVTLDGAVGEVGAIALDLLDVLGVGTVVDTYSHALRGFVADLPPAAATVLAALPGVASVEADGLMSIAATQTGAGYGLDRIDQRTRPLNGTYTYDTTGAGVTAYIIDTGIRATHTDFSGRVSSGVNTVDGSPSTQDCNGHGTHVAGTVGGEIYGVAKDVQFVAVRVFGCANTTPTSEIIEGVDWATGHHQAGQPAVANMSVGGGASPALDTAVRNLVADGVTVAIASGNESTNGCNGSPARVAEGITVGATDANDARASFSNWGGCVDLHAPGVAIVSASAGSDTGAATLSGTSMATPHVAGAAARHLQANPGASPAAVQGAIVANATTGAISGMATSCNFLQQLLGGCPGFGTPNRLLYTGSASAPPPPPPPPPPPCDIISQLLGLC